MKVAEDMRAAIERMEIYQAAQVRQQLSDFADYIYPDDGYVELQHAVEAIDQWIKGKEDQIKEVIGAR
ncbi:MAG: hypothetical protein GWP61_28740 [Chloroflexi bacterium]|nr:hypothetical protein [Chloroflexota bacterium]